MFLWSGCVSKLPILWPVPEVRVKRIKWYSIKSTVLAEENRKEWWKINNARLFDSPERVLGSHKRNSTEIKSGCYETCNVKCFFSSLRCIIACDALFWQWCDVTLVLRLARCENMAELDSAQLVRRLKRLYSSWKVGFVGCYAQKAFPITWVCNLAVPQVSVRNELFNLYCDQLKHRPYAVCVCVYWEKICTFFKWNKSAYAWLYPYLLGLRAASRYICVWVWLMGRRYSARNVEKIKSDRCTCSVIVTAFFWQNLLHTVYMHKDGCSAALPFKSTIF